MNDVRMEMASSAMYNIRCAAFVIKTLGKGYYPEAILGIHSLLVVNVSAKNGNDASRASLPQCRSQAFKNSVAGFSYNTSHTDDNQSLHRCSTVTHLTKTLIVGHLKGFYT